LAGLVIIVAVFAAGALAAACGGDSSGGSSAAAANDKFVGNWAPVDARLEITWADAKSYGISLATGSFGGLTVEKAGDAYTVVLVGNDDVASDPLPGTASGDVLAFDIPIMESSPTKATLTVAADGSAKVAFGTDSDGWAFKKVGALTTESK
jgi:hypothetical protein